MRNLVSNGKACPGDKIRVGFAFRRLVLSCSSFQDLRVRIWRRESHSRWFTLLSKRDTALSPQGEDSADTVPVSASGAPGPATAQVPGTVPAPSFGPAVVRVAVEAGNSRGAGRDGGASGIAKVKAVCEVDTIVISDGADGFEVSAADEVYFAAWSATLPEPAPFSGRPRPGRLPVPFFSQLFETAVPARRVCFPASISMVAAYHGVSLSIEQAAGLVYDPINRIYGNWLRGCAALGSAGFAARIFAMDGLDALLPFLERACPLILSVRFSEGSLDGAPLPSTDGHLLVCHGVDENGALLCNDPAGTDEKTGLTAYRADQFRRAWRGVAIAMLPAVKAWW